MYGPPPTRAEPRIRPETRARLVRWLFALIPVGSLGLGAWAPSLRFAVQRQRPLDWAVFGLFAAGTVGEILFLALTPEDENSDWNALAGFYVCCLLIGATVHAVRGDRFPRTPRTPHPSAYAYPPPAHFSPYAPTQTAPAPSPHAPTQATPTPPGPPAATSPRMRQVASELDALDAYLRRQEGR